MGQSGSLAFWNEGRNQWMNDAGKVPSSAMNFYVSRSTPIVDEIRPMNRAFAALFDPSRDLPNFPELLILQNRKGQSVDAL